MFTQTRTYNNRTSWDYDGPNGFNWFVPQLPYVASSGSSRAIVFDPNNPIWFDFLSGAFQTRYGTPFVSLARDAVAKTLTLTWTRDGRVEVTVFNDIDATVAPGQFVQQTDSRGVVTTVAALTGDRIDELQRSYAADGTTTYESLLYSYLDTGPNVDKLQSVTYRRRVGPTGAWTDVRRATYAYYESGDTDGDQGDLKAAYREDPDGSGEWDVVSVSYYRYYLFGDPSGFAHGLKMSFGPEAYRTMYNAGIDIESASDTVVKPYADHYFEYDPVTRAVTTEVAAACESCPGGGTTSDTFAYSKNPRHATNPYDPSLGYNVWTTKTVQTLPNGATNTVYNNYAGLPMLTVYTDADGTNHWCWFRRYADQPLPIWEAQPSAVIWASDYEDYDDLLHFDSGTGKYEYLRDNDGLIRVTDYYDVTDLPNGKVERRVDSENVRKGQLGSDVRIRHYTYTGHTDGDVTIYLTDTETIYPVEGSLTPAYTTSFSYDEWYSGNRLKKKTTTHPAVLTTQNGSGVSTTLVEEYDEFGRTVKRTDEANVVTTYEYSPVILSPIRETRNYVASPPPGATGVNLVTDYQYDDEGRRVQTMGPTHPAVVGGLSVNVRTTSWTVYASSPQPTSGNWGLDEVRSASGYATGTSPTYTYTPVDPVRIEQQDKDGRAVGSIRSKRTTGSGPLAPTDTFAQTDWSAWTSHQYNDRGQLTSTRVYHDIPASGVGVAGTNYAQTDYGYDALERRNRVRSPGGTITRTVWAAPQREASVWIGTDDTGATDANPAGSGAPNNMVVITENTYDGGNDGGNGNLTQAEQYASATDVRTTDYGYDWRDRRITEDGEIDFYAEYTYDNLDRVTRRDRYDTGPSGNLIARADTSYDALGRVYRSTTYAVDPSTGGVGNALNADTWYDGLGRPIKQIAAGAGIVFTKTSYAGAGWVDATYTGYDASEADYSAATDLTNDTIVQQVENTYDDTGNLISRATYQRLNDATGTGPLSAASQPKARVSYAAAWADGIGRMTFQANYGAIASFSRPDIPPASSDTVLVAQTYYDEAGRVWRSVDAAGSETRTSYDDAGRRTEIVEAYDDASTASDKNRTTRCVYTLDNQLARLTAVNADTGDQITSYTYGTSLADSGVARSDLLRYVDYPDSTADAWSALSVDRWSELGVADWAQMTVDQVSDREARTYSRLGQEATRTDPRGTVRSFDYDKLGRLIHDRVTAIGTETDDAVLRISYTYEVRGLSKEVTSYDSATVGSGIVLNQTKREYNSFAQLVKEYQDHAGLVGGTSPSIEYGFSDAGSGSNQVRQESLTYPNGRVLTYSYGSTGALNDLLNRVESIKDGTVALATYTYLGLSTVVRTEYPEPQVMLDLWGGTSGVFAGLDRFGRVVDQAWVTT